MKKTKQMLWVSAIVLASLSSALGSYLAPYSDTADTVSLWHMESIRSDKYIDDDDSVVIGRNATLQLGPNPVSTSGGPPVVDPGVYPAGNSAFGNALYLDGVDDSGAVANANLSLLDPSQLRMEFWAKSDAAVSGQYIFDRWGQILVYSDAAGFRVRVYDDDSGAIQDVYAKPAGFVATDWNHLAVEVDGEDVDVFVNGDLVNSATVTGGLSDTTSKTTTFIGMRYNNTGRWAGHIDEFRISTIPEPATISLMGITAVGIFVRRRFRR